VKQMTLRKIPVEVEKRVKAEAERKGVSLNKAFLSLLEQSAEISPKSRKKKKSVYHDLDHLAGKWSISEAEAFNRNLQSQRKREVGLWKEAE
jgi:hypothetical protein